ncbi:MAG: hypothetical protein DLM59_04150 [Pseudonocardiales bacterium]|nr:MAG: hypothetical protein DLM59_04150 [Pseudonocardiales bacterium]
MAQTPLHGRAGFHGDTSSKIQCILSAAKPNRNGYPVDRDVGRAEDHSTVIGLPCTRCHTIGDLRHSACLGTVVVACRLHGAKQVQAAPRGQPASGNSVDVGPKVVQRLPNNLA